MDGEGNRAVQPSGTSAPRNFLLRDSVTFFVLVASTVALYAVTSFLFRSFEERRQSLASQYLKQGETAIKEGHPTEAVAALRMANSYSPDERQTHLLLAQALADSGRTEEATNYFLALRESQPGNGFINLQLARLARKSGDRQRAVDFYRSSALGTWDRDGVARRQQVELELAAYLIENGDFTAARGELLVAAANTPETVSSDLLFGDRLLEAKAPEDAMSYYRKALALEPHNFEALEKTGRQLYAAGDYGKAQKTLDLAIRYAPKSEKNDHLADDLKTLADKAERLADLNLSKDLPVRDRARHILTAAPIARARLTACLSQADENQQVPELRTLADAWEDVGKNLRTAVENPADQDHIVQLIFDTETKTVNHCGAPQGDDALLLHLAQHTNGAASAAEVQ